MSRLGGGCSVNSNNRENVTHLGPRVGPSPACRAASSPRHAMTHSDHKSGGGLEPAAANPEPWDLVPHSDDNRHSRNQRRGGQNRKCEDLETSHSNKGKWRGVGEHFFSACDSFHYAYYGAALRRTTPLLNIYIHVRDRFHMLHARSMAFCACRCGHRRP